MTKAQIQGQKAQEFHKKLDSNSEQIATYFFRSENAGIDVGDMSFEERCEIIATAEDLKPYSVSRVQEWLECKYYAEQFC